MVKYMTLGRSNGQGSPQKVEVGAEVQNLDGLGRDNFARVSAVYELGIGRE